MKKILKNNYEIIIGIIIFITILVTKIEFYKAIIILLEFIVILEVVKMTMDFINKNKLSLRYIIDVFIIFLIRDIVILVTNEHYNKDKIIFLLFIVATFFIFRVVSIKFSPVLYKKVKNN